FFPLVGALATWRAGLDPMPWIERALERAVVHPRAHFLLANVLARYGWSSQAMLELRTALDQEPGLAGPAAALALATARAPHALLGLVPPGRRGLLLLDEIAQRLPEPRDAALRARMADEA